MALFKNKNDTTGKWEGVGAGFIANDDGSNKFTPDDLATGSKSVGDSKKLGGQLPSYYATKTEVSNLAGEGRTDETVKDNADNILALINDVGNLNSLKTTEKANLVLALNEVYQNLVTHQADNVTQGGGVHGLEYEEGVFTPKYTPQNGSFATIKYETQIGNYVKINNLVVANIDISITNDAEIGDASGRLYITGLPFVPKLYTSGSIGMYWRFNDIEGIGTLLLDINGNIMIGKTTHSGINWDVVQVDSIGYPAGVVSNYLRATISYQI